MKKLVWCNLDVIATLLPELNENEQRNIIGGSGSCFSDSPVPLPVETCICNEVSSVVKTETFSENPIISSVECTGMVPTITTTCTPILSTSVTKPENDHSVMLGAIAISATLAADDVTGVGIIDDITIPFILGDAAIYEGYKYITTNDTPSYGNFGNPQDWTYTVPSQPFYEIPPMDNGSFGPEGASKWWLIPGGAALAKEMKEGAEIQIPYRYDSDNK